MENSAFIEYWDSLMRIGAYASIGVAFLIFLYYEVKVSSIKDLKEKYDFVNLHEIKYFWYSIICLIFALGFFINSIATETIITTSMLWFYVRLFITASYLVISYFIFYGMVRVYYPKNVEKRLVKLRNKPRVSPAGNIMRRLSEEEEDAHLEPSQIAEEEIHSIDYDVWIDEKTGFKKVEKYFSYQHAVQCPECGFYTMKIAQEELERAPTSDQPGIILRHYKCQYCDYREQQEVAIASLSDNI